MRNRWKQKIDFVQIRWLLLVPIVTGVLAGCDGGSGYDYLIWPSAVRTGDSVAILFNTEFDTNRAPESALLDASVDNIRIQLSDSLGFTESVTPRAVIEMPAPLGSLLVGPEFESWTGLVAIFEIPDPWPNASVSYPDTFRVVVEYQGTATFGGHVLVVLGPGGSPLARSLAPSLSALESGPMLRLRPAWDPVTGEGFDPAWEIGGLEFTLRFTKPPVGDISNLAAVGNGEATAGLAFVQPLPPEGSDKLWKVTLLHPEGFRLPDKGCVVPGECYSGRWSLLDLPLDKDTTGVAEGEPVFIPEDFAIEALVVVDPDGTRINPSFDGETFFNAYAVNYRAVPEPGTALLLISGALGLALIERLHTREQRRGRASS